MDLNVNDPRHGEITVTPHVKFLVEKDKREWCPQRTEPWYEKRRNHLTASQIASACGENPYETRTTAIRKKLGVEAPFTGNAATEHGNKYEDVAIEKYEKMTGEKVLAFGLLESLNENEKYLAGSPDGITASGRLIEVKCPFRRKPNGQIPKHYVHQVQTLMRILNLSVCDFIEYVPTGTWTEEIFTICTVRRDDFFWWRIEPKLKCFWDQVVELREKLAQDRDYKDGDVLKEETEKQRPRKKRVLALKVCEIEAGKPEEEEEEMTGEKWSFPKEFLDAIDEKLSAN